MSEETRPTDSLINKCITDITEIKRQEEELKQRRFKAEKWLFDALSIKAEQKGTQHFENETFRVSFKKNFDVKVDPVLLDDIVRKHPEIDKNKLFRTKVEVVAKEYSAADESIKNFLIPCITTKANKPTVEIIRKEK